MNGETGWAQHELAALGVDMAKQMMGLRNVGRLALAALSLCPPGSIACALTVSEYVERGNAHFRAREYDKAIVAYDEAIRLNPRYENAYNNRGVIYENKKDYARALENYDKALSINPNYPRVHYNKGNIYFEQKHLDKAIESYTAAIQTDNRVSGDTFDKIEAFSARARTYNANFEQNLAIADFDEVIRRNPSLATAYNDRGEPSEAGTRRLHASDPPPAGPRTRLLKPWRSIPSSQGLHSSAQGL